MRKKRTSIEQDVSSQVKRLKPNIPSVIADSDNDFFEASGEDLEKDKVGDEEKDEKIVEIVTTEEVSKDMDMVEEIRVDAEEQHSLPVAVERPTEDEVVVKDHKIEEEEVAQSLASRTRGNFCRPSRYDRDPLGKGFHCQTSQIFFESIFHFFLLTLFKKYVYPSVVICLSKHLCIQ